MTVADRCQRLMPADWPLPPPTPFFTAGRLVVQRCRTCRSVQHPPLDLCHRCQGFELEAEPAAGTGTISSFTIVHHAADPRLASIVPYNVVVVELDDHPGLEVVGNVVDAAPGQLAVGLAVECTFAAAPDPDTGEELLLPHWRLRH